MKGFRCDHYYEDGSCYGGPDGGDCPARKKREQQWVESSPVEKSLQHFNTSRSLSLRQKRQVDDVIGCLRGKGTDYRGRASQTVDGVPCVKWTEGLGGRHSDQGDHNFCRNPSDNPNGVWCTTGASSFGFCDVPKCDPVVKTRNVSCSDWVSGRAYWKWDHEIPSTCQSEFQTKFNIEGVFNIIFFFYLLHYAPSPNMVYYMIDYSKVN